MNELYKVLDNYNPFIVVLKLNSKGELFVKEPGKNEKKIIDLSHLGLAIQEDRKILKKVKNKLNFMGYEVVLK